MPFLRDAALLPLSLAEQNRVIADLHGLVERLRGEAAAFPIPPARLGPGGRPPRNSGCR